MKEFSYKSADFAAQLKAVAVHEQAGQDVAAVVRDIIHEVRRKGDDAVVEISNRFSPVKVSCKSLCLKTRARRPAAAVVAALDQARENVERFSKLSMPKSWRARNAQGARFGEHYAPLRRVGIYVPGGTAPLVSTAIMTVTLARVAGVREIVVCSPPPINPVMHYAIQFAGATEVYQIGGAQAVAAMAYGTRSLKRVDKIFGPGNAYVVEAKRQVFGDVGVDLLPGPSEIAVLADGTARAEDIAADMLAQAEHGPGSRIFLVTPDRRMLDAVKKQLAVQMAKLKRQEFLKQTLDRGSYLIHVKSIAAGVAVIEDLAPEHLSLVCKHQDKLALTIRNCGAIYVGGYSPVAMGDYVAGPSHELPTGGVGKAFSGLRVSDFMRRTSIVSYDKKALLKGAGAAVVLAAIEGMDAHAESINIRTRKSK